MSNPFVEYDNYNTGAPGGWFFEILQTAVIALAICVVLWLFVVQGNEVDGQSMDPTFHDRELVLTDKIIQRFGEYKRLDVVIFRNSLSGQDFIKRIVGMPGDSVMIKEGYVYINGEKDNQTYLPEGRITKGGNFLAEGESLIIPENKYFMMGDNRSASRDSRDKSVALIDRSDIKGRVFLVYWPPNSDHLGLINRYDN